ncbi:MAG: hypothetical protein ACREHD_03435, partial [Pirellulales bacterium]
IFVIAISPIIFAEALRPWHPLLLHVCLFVASGVIVINSPPVFYVSTSFTFLLVGGRRAVCLLGQHVIEIKGEELIQSTQINRFAWKLSAIGKLYQASGLIIIALPLGQFLFVPASSDFGADSFDTFFAKLKAAVEAAKNRSG